MEGDDVAVALGHLLQDGNLIPDLGKEMRGAHQMLRSGFRAESGAIEGSWDGEVEGRLVAERRRRTMYSRPSISFLLMTLQA